MNRYLVALHGKAVHMVTDACREFARASLDPATPWQVARRKGQRLDRLRRYERRIFCAAYDVLLVSPGARP